MTDAVAPVVDLEDVDEWVIADRPAIKHETPLNAMPRDAQELARCLANPEWRIFSGCMYKIMVKGDGDDDAEAMVMPFKPNRAQRRFVRRMWHRNLILKARQLGFTTLVAILWLDHALWNANQRCGIIAQDLENAQAIFRDKVKFAYENLPVQIRDRFPLIKDSTKELHFGHNNSSIRVATSMRGGTIHRLHISEFGKICAKYPDKANEVVTGSIPAVPLNGILVIESTAEGRQGEFYKQVKLAQKNEVDRKILTPRDYRLHFYGWWQEPKYRMPSTLVELTREDHDYFDMLEGLIGQSIDPDQRAWYVATRNADFTGAEEKMWQEYPSTPDEAFQVSTEGNYFARDIQAVRKRGGIGSFPQIDSPVHTFWDIGRSDGCAIWYLQQLRSEDRFIGYDEDHNKDLKHYVKLIRDRGYVLGTMFLPHDAAHKRLSDTNKSTKEMLEELMPGVDFVVVPRVTELQTGIQAARKHLKHVVFDEKGCELGINRLENYKKKFSRTEARFLDVPDKSNGCSEGADAYRQYAQAKELGWVDNPALIEREETKHAAEEIVDWRL